MAIAIAAVGQQKPTHVVLRGTHGRREASGRAFYRPGQKVALSPKEALAWEREGYAESIESNSRRISSEARQRGGDNDPSGGRAER